MKTRVPKRSTTRTTKKKVALDPASIVTFDDLPEEQTMPFMGLIAPDGNPGGSRLGRDKTWTFSTHLSAWQVKGGPVVQEPALVICTKISERKLSSLMKCVSNLDIIEFTAQKPRKSQRPFASPLPQFELISFGKKVRAPDLQKLKQKLSKPVVVSDAVFGNLELDRQHKWFRTSASFRGADMYVHFLTTSTDELKELLKHAKPFWKKREAWFSTWREKVYEYYGKELAGFWCEDTELTEKRFYDLLRWPVGVEFSFWKGKFGYTLGGWSEELFTDHGINANGTSIDNMVVVF